jgi:hypothetical protein
MLRKLALAALVWLILPLACVQAQVGIVRLASTPSSGSYGFYNGRFYRTNSGASASRFYSYYPVYPGTTVYLAPLYAQPVPTPLYVQPSAPSGFVPATVSPAPAYGQLAPTPVYVQPSPSSGFVPPATGSIYVQPAPVQSAAPSVPASEVPPS